MLHLKSIGTPLVLALALFALAGCDQAEKSAQTKLLNRPSRPSTTPTRPPSGR